MRLIHRQFLWAQLACLLLIAGAAILMPGAGFFVTLPSVIILWFIVEAAYRLTPYTNAAGHYTLLIVTTLLSLGVIANVHMYTSPDGASDSFPLLINDDLRKYFLGALHIIGDPRGVPIEPIHFGYPYIIAAIWSVTGVSIFFPIIINAALLLLSIILTGIIAARIIGDATPRSSAWIATAAMIVISAVAYLLATGILLLKEAGTVFAITAAILPFTRATLIKVSTPRSFIFRVAAFLLPLILLMLLRFNYIVIIALGIVILTPWSRKSIRSQLSSFNSVALLLCILAWATMHIILANAAIDLNHIVVNSIKGGALAGAYFYDNPQHAAHNAMVAHYFEFPIWKRLLYLPFSAATQFLIPFPWAFERNLPEGYTFVYARFAFPWYLIGGTIIYFLATSLRRIPQRMLRLTIFAVIAWLTPAYLTAGTVSRYALCFLPLLVPLAVYTVATVGRTRAFRIYLCIFSIMIIAILIACYHIQQAPL